MSGAIQMASTYIRWMIRSDLDAVVAIEKESSEYPWSKEEFRIALRQTPCIAMVAERNEEVVGYVLYERTRHRLTVLNLAVRERSRRLGVGSEIIQKLKDKIDFHRRMTIELDIRESNLGAQLFARSNGLRCNHILANWYTQPDEAAYRFEFPAGGHSNG